MNLFHDFGSNEIQCIYTITIYFVHQNVNEHEKNDRNQFSL